MAPRPRKATFVIGFIREMGWVNYQKLRMDEHGVLLEVVWRLRAR
jgi:hypothetical protein